MRLQSRIVDDRDFTTALIFLAVSGIALAEGVRLSQNPLAFRMNQVLRPGYYLILIASLLLISGIFYLVSLIRSADKVTDKAAEKAATDTSDESRFMGRLTWLVVALVAYGLLIGFLGYVLATPIFFIAASLIFGVRKLVPLLVLSLGFSTVLVVLFIYLLRVRMPTGVFNLFNF